jgi:FtsP/CotA-like multicopper oxidase with cupredoxin domain
MITRRRFIGSALAAGAGIFIVSRADPEHALAAPPLRRPAYRSYHPDLPLPGGTLDPTTIAKYVTPLVNPPAMPKTPTGDSSLDYYEIAVRQFRQQILPLDKPGTTVWSYGSHNDPSTFNYPAFTIEATYERPVRVKWINRLVDASGNYLPHLLTNCVDPTLHWANPPGGTTGRDSRPTFTSTPGPYHGPVPIVTHVHGAHVSDESDGYAEAWYLPTAKNIPAGYANYGTWYNRFKDKFATAHGVTWEPGTATFQYPNNQRAATMWYHDHTLGMTRLNVYAGPAGFYLLRGGTSDLAPGPLPAPPLYEIPIVFQDRSFNVDGSLFFPTSREFFDQTPGPFIPGTDVSPYWNPEFFGNTMVVNGNTWPTLDVEKRRYRFRFLNGCNARFVMLRLVTGDPAARPAVSVLPFWQIGAEGGFLKQPVQLNRLLMSPAERADVIVDFTGLPLNTLVYLINEGPDEPFSGGEPGVEFEYADPGTTGQVMRFRVVPSTGQDSSLPPDQLVLPTYTPLGAASVTRQVSLNEMMSMYFADTPIAAMLGTVDLTNPADPQGIPQMWSDPITEDPLSGTTEIWEIYNLTVDAHPIHLHEVMFEVVNRQPFGAVARPPESWESARKDTVIAYPQEITRIKARFDIPGRYVWHCHIVDHEDNEMMRPMEVRAHKLDMPFVGNSAAL